MGKKAKSKWIHLGGSSNPVGYCHYHKSTISKQQLKSKQCIEKNCNRFQKYDCEYWEVLNKIKTKKAENRKSRKDKIRNQYKNMDKKRLKKAIEYCKKCPESKEKALEYCSQCPYSEKCMSGIMDMIYEYITTYHELDE